MNDRTLKLYHSLPSSLRSASASLRGLYLRWWRFSSRTNSLIDEALQRDTWTNEQWKRWQEERLGFVLHRAATEVPFYKEQWSARRRRGDKSSWELIENWPVLEKDSLRVNPKAFVAQDCDLRKMFHDHTSGTTGKSLDAWASRDTIQRLYALSEARSRFWHGVTRNDRWAMIGGQLVTPVSNSKPPFWVWNKALNQLYMSSYHLSPDFIPYYLDALARYEIKYIVGYTSSLYELAQEALRLKRSELNMAVVITNAEPVYDYQRMAISEAFQSPVRETYGMVEMVAAASECEAHKLHLWPELGRMEIIEGDRPVTVSEVGDIVSTGLLNADMPLIRYRVGDRGTLSGQAGVCGCGRRLPVLASVEGRVDDLLYTSDGRRVGRLDPIFKARLPVREAQVIQESLNRIRVRYVPTKEWKSTDGQSIIERLRARMGNIEVVLEALDEVPRTSNGKFRAVVCQLSAGERRALTQ